MISAVVIELAVGKKIGKKKGVGKKKILLYIDVWEVKGSVWYSGPHFVFLPWMVFLLLTPPNV